MIPQAFDNTLSGELESTRRDTMTKVKVASKSELGSNQMMGLEVKGRYILLANVEGEYFAIDGLCSHAKGKLWEGSLMGTIVKCPRHGSEFDLRTGKLVKKPRIPLAKARDLSRYDVTVEGDEVLLDI
jgi:3-phenylpropionate/trans-cinnamate dioxygenase ferredoxin subunit